MSELNNVVVSRGSGISKDAITGVIKCYKSNLNKIAEDKQGKNSLNKPGPTHDPQSPSQYRRIQGRPVVGLQFVRVFLLLIFLNP